MAAAIQTRRFQRNAIAGQVADPSPARPVAPTVGRAPSLPSFQGFLKAVQRGDRRTLEQVYKSPYVQRPPTQVRKTAMGETSGVVGGYLVPVEYTAQLLQSFEEDSFIYPRAWVVPMHGQELQAPTVNATTAQSAGTAPYFGGLNFSWGASQAPSETEPTFKTANLHAWDLLGYATVSNQWLSDVGGQPDPSWPKADGGPQDSFRDGTGDQALLELFGRAAAWYAEYAFLRGLGADASMPLGILNSPALLTGSRATPSTIVAADIAGMAAKMLPFGWKSAIWACHPSCLAQIMKISTYQLSEYHGEQADGRCGTLIGRPLFVTDKLPALGTRGDLIFFDPRLYVIGDRQEVLVDASTLGPAFRTNQTDFRVWMRLDGLPLLSNAVTLADGTQTASPYVALAA